MTALDIELVRLTPEDWMSHRALRLRALATDPSAFGASYADNAAYDEATWRSRLATATYWQARSEGAPVGMIGLWDPVHDTGGSAGLPQDADVAPFVISMFVLPTARHRGVGRALLNAALDEARARGYRQIVLDVTEGNAAAVALYQSAGFRVAEERQPPVGNGCQVGMVLDLG